jgi:APA family basic amino acid/polyamine antiporter
VLTGIAAATKAGPAVSLSFVLAGVACALAALCYAEFASTVPVPAAPTPSPTPPWAS